MANASEKDVNNAPANADNSMADAIDLPGGRRYAQIVGWGCSVPEKVITNKDLEQIVDTTDEWIRTRTGIEERRVVTDPKQTTATLATEAARRALEVADVPPSKVDLVICATSSPEYIFPATACLVQDALGAHNAGAFDLLAACSGFVYGLGMARGQILAGDAEYVLVIGSETLSRLVDWTDRNTCVLFGDGAGAVLVAASDVPGGILTTKLGSDGSGGEALIIHAGGSAMPTSLETVSNGSHYAQMDGKAVFRFATKVMASATREVLERANMTIDDIDFIILTAYGTIDTAIQAMKIGALDYILKPLKEPDELRHAINKAYERRRLIDQNLALTTALSREMPPLEIVFAGMEDILNEVQGTGLIAQQQKLTELEWAGRLKPSS